MSSVAVFVVTALESPDVKPSVAVSEASTTISSTIVTFAQLLLAAATKVISGEDTL